MQIEKAYRFDNVSVIVSPYYSFGSLLVGTSSLLCAFYQLFTTFNRSSFLPQNLVNAHMTSSTREMLPETMLAYYSREIISAVATLHQCGILHADIKPDNFMLRNIT